MKLHIPGRAMLVREPMWFADYGFWIANCGFQIERNT